MSDVTREDLGYIATITGYWIHEKDRAAAFEAQLRAAKARIEELELRIAFRNAKED